MIYYRYNKGKEVNTMNFKKMTAGQGFGTIAGKVAVWFISAAFIWWGLEHLRRAFQPSSV